MRKVGRITVAALSITAPSVMFSAAELVPANVTVGQNLQTDTRITLNGPAPGGGLVISLKSNDPSRLLFSTMPNAAGSASIALTVDGGRAITPEFYVHGLANSGTATYIVSAPGHASSTGMVTLAPSAIVIAGSSRLGNPLVTTSGAWPSTITVYSAQLDASGRFVGVQQVRGGSSATVNVTSSNTRVGTITISPVTIAGGAFNVTTQFQPVGRGSATLAVEIPPGFGGPAQFATMTATVDTPALAVTDEVTVGANLEAGGTLLLGERAPAGGVTATLTSSDPTRLLLSASPTAVGSKSIAIVISAGEYNASYFLQALGDSGVVTYHASAPGYRDRAATVTLAPSGVVLAGPAGAPDEAEVLRPEAPEGPHGFFASLSAHNTSLVVVYMVYLDPKTHRGADLTVQPLRAGLSITVALSNSNPAVGTVPSSVTIMGGSNQGITQFGPLSVGSTVLSVATPKGFTTASNATSLKAVVTQ